MVPYLNLFFPLRILPAACLAALLSYLLSRQAPERYLAGSRRSITTVSNVADNSLSSRTFYTGDPDGDHYR